jgi:hypothetical protein
MWIPDSSPQDEDCLRTVHIVWYGLRVCHATSHIRKHLNAHIRWQCNWVLPSAFPFKTHYSITTARKHLDAHIRTIVVLIGGKLTEFTFCIYFQNLLFYNDTPTTICKKVSFLPPGDVNLGPVPSRQGLLEDSPYRVICATCLLCNWLWPHT